MLDSLFQFFDNLFNNWSDAGLDIIDQLKFNINGGSITLAQWLSITCAYISLIFIVVLCCLFVYKIIKLIGGLIR